MKPRFLYWAASMPAMPAWRIRSVQPMSEAEQILRLPPQNDTAVNGYAFSPEQLSGAIQLFPPAFPLISRMLPPAGRLQ